VILLCKLIGKEHEETLEARTLDDVFLKHDYQIEEKGYE